MFSNLLTDKSIADTREQCPTGTFRSGQIIIFNADNTTQICCTSLLLRCFLQIATLSEQNFTSLISWKHHLAADTVKIGNVK